MGSRLTKLFVVGVLFLLCVVTLVYASYAQEEASEERIIIAQVNGEPVYLDEVKEVWDSLPQEYKAQFPGGIKDLLEQWIRQILLVQEAQKEGLAEDPEVARKIENLRKQILIQELIQRKIVNVVKVTDEEIEDEYTAHPELYTEPEKVKAKHIMVSSEQQAQEVLNELRSGKPFEEVAKEKSESPDASSGGDMGYVERGDLSEEIEKVVFELAPGNFSDAIKTDYGFHIFMVEEHVPPRLKEIDEVKEEITARLLPKKQQEAFEELIRELKKSSEIVIFEENIPVSDSSSSSGEGATE
ncbi:MAG: peptidylprolyl isomerase [Candidatus Atribacteria bacterium]|nr:peptidylprolyl isomerase [Candidatus Atribacteria bacterium]MCD6349282.1 peptidylprolyl isomerase [Candidatus Atribacteria bacterium]